MDKKINLDYELFKTLCEEYKLPSERLFTCIDERRIIVEPVEGSSILHLTIINKGKDNNEATNVRLANIRFNIRKLAMIIPSIILDGPGFKLDDTVNNIYRGIMIMASILGLLSIKLKENETNVLYALWRMDGWNHDITWEKAFEETNKMLEEMDSKAISEAEFAKALESLSGYGLIELEQESIHNLDKGKNYIKVLDHQLYSI